MNSVLVSHASDDWATPAEIYEMFLSLGFFDPCPLRSSVDGLALDWEPFNYVNPPYSKLKVWASKAIDEYRKGKLVYMLIPARTDTKAFRMLWEAGARFWFITGRLSFGGVGCAPFPSLLVCLGDICLPPNYCGLLDKSSIVLDLAPIVRDSAYRYRRTDK